MKTELYQSTITVLTLANAYVQRGISLRSTGGELVPIQQQLPPASNQRIMKALTLAK